MPEQKGGTGQNGEVKPEEDRLLSARNAVTAAATTTRVCFCAGSACHFLTANMSEMMWWTRRCVFSSLLRQQLLESYFGYFW